MKNLVKFIFVSLLLFSTNSFADYDQAYDECDNKVSEKVDYSDNYDLWQQELNNCLKAKGYEENPYESQNESESEE